MTTYSLPSDGVYEFDPAYDYASHSMVASGSGTVAVEFRHPGSDVWRPVPDGTLDAATGNIVTFTGIVDQFSFTLTGSTGGATVTSRTQEITAFGSNAVSGPDGFQRLRVDAGEPGFWAAQQFAWEYELILAAGETQAFRFDLPVDVILLDSNITVDDGSLYYRVYRADQITETGAFATDVSSRAHSLMLASFAPTYTRQTMAFTDGPSADGGVTIDDDAPYPIARVRTSGATAHASLVGADAGLMRGFPPTSAYVVATQLPGASGGTQGIITLKFEERTWGY